MDLRNFNTFGTINSIHNSMVDNMKSADNGNIKTEDLYEYYEQTKKGKRAMEIQLSSIKNYSNVENILKNINDLKNAELIAGVDVETFGSMEDSKTFMVSEVAVVEKMVGEEIELIHDFKAGIPKNRVKKTTQIMTDYLNGQPLPEAELASARVGALRMPYVINPTRNIENRMIDTYNIPVAMRDLEKLGPAYGSDKAIEGVEAIRNTLSTYIENGTPIVGHNINKADIPWLNKLFKDHNLEELDFSKGNIIDTFEIAQVAFGESLYDLFAGADMTNTRRNQSLEAFAKLTGQKIDAHIAESDIKANVNMLFSNVTGSGKTLLEAAEESIYERIESSGLESIGSDKSRVLYARNSVKRNNDLDFMLDAEGKPITYRDYVNTRGVFYEIDGFSYVPKNELSESIASTLPSDSEGLYSIKLNTYGDDGIVSHSTVINRGSLGELTDAIGNNFSVYDVVDSIEETKEVGNRVVTKEFAKKQISIYENDLARRSFDAMTDVTSDKGYNYAKEMYNTYDTSVEVLGGMASKDNIVKLAKEGSIDVAGVAISVEDIAPNMSKEKFRDFANMYNVLDDTRDTMVPIINSIETGLEDQLKLIPTINSIEQEYKDRGIYKGKENEYAKRERRKLVNSKKTEVLKNSIDELKSVSGEEIISSTGKVDDNLSFANYGSVKINGEYTNIDLSTKETSAEGLFWKVRGTGELAGSKMNQEAIRVQTVKDVAKDLYERNIISEAEFDKFSNLKDPTTSSKYLGGLLFDAKENLIESNGGVENYIKNHIELEGTTGKINMNPASEFGSGIKIGDVSLDTYVKENGAELMAKKYGGSVDGYKSSEFIDDMISSAINKSSVEFNLRNIGTEKWHSGEITGDYKRLRKSMEGYLSENLNYDDKHINAVSDAIMGSKSSYLNRGYSVSLASYKNKAGDIEHGIIAYTQKNEAAVKKALADGVLPERAIIHPLVGINKKLDGELLTVSRGLNEKRIVEEITSYKNTDNTGSVGEKLAYSYKISDTVTDSIRQPNMSYKVIDEMYSKGNYEGARNTAMKRAGKSIMDSSGASAAQTVRIGGKPRKEIIPKMSDLVNISYADGILSAVPQMYDNNPEFKKAMQEAIGIDYSEAVIEKMSKAYEKGENLTFSSLNSSYLNFGEWFQTNLIHGEGIAKQMIDNGVLPENISKKLGEYIEGNPSQLLKEKLLGEHIAISNGITPADLTPYGWLNNPRRPQHVQYLNSTPILNQEIEEFAKEHGIDDIRGKFASKKNADVGIVLGDIVQTDIAHEKYFKPMAIEQADRGGITLGIYGGVKQVSPVDLQVELMNFDKEEFLSKFNEGKSVDQLATMEDVEDLIWQYGAGGGTNEQHSYISPDIDKYIRFNDELKTINIDEDVIGELKEGARIEKGDVIGYKTLDGQKVPVKYDGQAGKIGSIDYDKGKAFVELDKPAFDEKKYITGFFEKSVGSSIRTTTDGREVQDLSQSLFESLFGDGTIQVANFEYGKHETGSAVIGSNSNIIAEIIRNSDDSESTQKIIDVMNNRLDGWNVRLGKDEGNKVGNVLVMDVSRKPTYDVDGMRNVISDIRDLSINGETENIKNVSKKIVDTIDHFNENNLLYLPVNASNLSEMVSFAGEEGGKGNKYSLRTDQIFGGYYDKGFRVIGPNGEIEKIAQPILDDIQRDIQGSKAYKSASRDISNIVEAARLADGREANNPGRVKKMKLEDLPALDKGNLNAQTLSDTIFGDMINDFDVIELDLGDRVYTNPYNKAKTNKVYIPLGGAHIIDDEQIFFSKNMKLSNDLILDLQRANNLEFERYGSMKELNKSIENRIEALYSNFDYEMNHKKGLVSQTMLSGRVSNSAGVVNGGIIDMHFTDESNSKILHQLGDQVIEIGEDGKPKYLDVSFVSKDLITDMGLKDDVVAEQIIKENLGGDAFRKSITEKGYIKEDGAYNVLSEEEYYKVVTPFNEIENRPEFSYEQFKEETAIPKPINEKPLSKKEFINSDIGAVKYPEKPNYETLDSIEDFYKTKPVRPVKEEFREKFISNYINEANKIGTDKNQTELMEEALDSWRYEGMTEYKEMLTEYSEDKAKFYDKLNSMKESNQRKIETNKSLKREWNSEKAHVREINNKSYERYRDSFQAFVNDGKKEEVYNANKESYEFMSNEHNDDYSEWYEKLIKYNEENSYDNYLKNELSTIQTKIAEEYYQNIGLQGITLRNPTFHEGSMQASIIKMHKGLKGNTVILSEGMAKRLNADVDGDPIFLNFLLGTDENGKLKIRNNDEIDNAFNKMIDLQSELNAKEVASKPTTSVKVDESTGKIIETMVDLSDEEAKKVKLNFASNIDDLEVKLFDLYGEDIIKENGNYLTKEKTIMTAIKSRHNKSAIGPLSIQGFKVRDTLTGVATNGYYSEILERLQRTSNFSTLSEQKIIDVKHDVDGMLTTAGIFGDAIKEMGESDGKVEKLNAGFKKLYGAMINSTVYDKETIESMPSVEDIIKGNFDNSNERANELKSIYDVFNSEEGLRAYNEPLSQGGHGFRAIENNKYTLDALEGKEVSTDVAKKKVNVVTDAMDKILIDNISESSDSYKNVTFVKKGEFDGDFDLFNIVDIGKTKANNSRYVKIEDVVTGEQYKFNGNSFNEIGEQINLTHDVFYGDSKSSIVDSIKVGANLENAKNAHITSETVKTITDTDSSFKNIVLADMVENGVSLDSNSDDLVKIVDNTIEKYGGSEKNVKAVLDEIEMFQKGSDNYKNIKYDVYKNISNNFDTVDRQIIAEASLVLDDMRASGKLSKVQSDDAMVKINEDIIDKGRKAKNRNALKKENMNKIIEDIASESLDNDKINDIIGSIDNNKMFNVAEAISEHNIMKEETLKSLEEVFERGTDNYSEFDKMLNDAIESSIGKISKHNLDVIEANNKLFEISYNLDGGKEKVLNWKSYDDKMFDIIDIEDSKIGFGNYSNLSIKDISIMELGEIANDTSIDTELARESRKRVNDYLSVVNSDNYKSTNPIFSRKTNINKVTKSVGNEIDVDSINRGIIKAAKDKKEKLADELENLAKETIGDVGENIGKSKWYNNKYVITAGVVLAALGVATATRQGERYLDAPGTVSNRGNSDDNEQQLTSDKTFQAPPTPNHKNRAMLEGVGFRVSGRSKNEIDTAQMMDSIGKTVGQTTGAEINVNSNQYDSRKEVSDSWLKGKFAELIK